MFNYNKLLQIEQRQTIFIKVLRKPLSALYFSRDKLRNKNWFCAGDEVYEEHKK